MVGHWYDNKIQFCRLLTEINDNVEFTDEQKTAIEESMDLKWKHIEELFERAQNDFDAVKLELLNDSRKEVL